MSKKSKAAAVRLLSIAFALIFILGLWFVYSGSAGISKRNLEKDFISQCHIDENMTINKAQGDDAVAFLAYGQDDSDADLALYAKNAVGRYVYAGGGDIECGDDEIAEYKIQNCKSKVYASINECKIAVIRVYSNLLEPEIIEIDPDKPFVYAEPKGVKNIEFINEEDEMVESVKRVY